MTGHAYRAGASARVLRFDCGRVCLDLAATAHPVERLDGPDRLRQWLVGAGLVPPGTPLERAGPGWLAAFRDLRTQIAAVVGAELDGRPPGHALDRVNAVARNPPPRRAPSAGPTAPSAGACPATPTARRCWARSPATRWTCSPTPWPAPCSAAAPGRTARWSTSTPRAAMRRRWCSGETCGNRERVARHRRSRRG